MLLTGQRRLTGWAKAAAKAFPNLVLKLSELPDGVHKNQIVCAATLVVPHTCRDQTPARSEEEVRTSLTSLGLITPRPCSTVSLIPCSTRAVPRADGRLRFYDYIPLLGVGAHAIGEEGHDRPADGRLATGEIRHGGQTVCSYIASPCGAQPTHNHFSPRAATSLLTCKCEVVYAAQIVSPPLAAPESNLGDRSTSSGT